jgi:hypothetical protein
MSIMKRFFVLAMRFFAVVGILVTITAAWLFLSEPTISVWWHLIHGNKVAFQGHKITLPLMWRVDRSDKEPGLNLSRVINGTVTMPLLNLRSIAQNGIGVVDNASAMQWQLEFVSKLNSKSSIYHYTPENLQSKLLTFYCVDGGIVGKQADSMFCKVGGTNWNVAYSGDKEHLQDAKDVLKSIL